MNIKKFSFLSVIVAVLLLAGCAQTNVDVDAPNQQQAANDNQGGQQEQQPAGLDNGGSTQNATGDEGATAATTDSSLRSDGNYVMINGEKVFLQNIYFAFDRYILNEPMKIISKDNSGKLSMLDENNKIKLEGNCDEWGSDEYNYALGLKRAKEAKNELIADGIPPSKITLVSYGESNPVCTEHNKKCWEKNRRVAYKVLP